MKTKLLITSLLLLATVGCLSKRDVSAWQEHKTLAKIWSRIESENVQKIIFCETDVPEIDDWFVRFEVPPEAINESIQLIGKALDETEIRRNIWEIKRMKIVTDKSKYIVPANWTSQKIYGNDWTSFELRSYLRKHGFADPE